VNFRFETIVPFPLESVFAFHESAARLELLHLGRPKVRVLAHEPRVRVGGETWIEISLLGLVPLALGFRHTHFEAPTGFGERLIHGPFSWFVHNHEFAPAPGGTLVRDLLEIRLPWYYGGETMMRTAVAPRLTRMFHERAEALNRLVENGCFPGHPYESWQKKGL